jgi:hypothetical protein
MRSKKPTKEPPLLTEIVEDVHLNANAPFIFVKNV